MSFDGTFAHAMTLELNHQIKGGRVDKINQPYTNEVVMNLRVHRQNVSLLLSANPAYARVQVTNFPYTNPPEPSNFTMNLRKYLQGGILKKIKQVANDRVIRFHFLTRNELGDLQRILLIAEIMGRHSNIIMVDQSDMTIIDAMKLISHNQNRYRVILPGFKYVGPPKQTSHDPFTFTDFSKLGRLIKAYPNQDVLAHHLQRLIQGLGRDTARQLAISLHHGNDFKTSFRHFFDNFNHPVPTLSTKPNGKSAFTVYPFVKTLHHRRFASLSGLLDHYYHKREKQDRIREKGATLIHVARREIKKDRRKEKKLHKTYQASQHASNYKIKGEILTTYMYKVKTGMSQIKLPNYYQNNRPINIKLSYNRTPSENAQWYFKRYRKRKRGGRYAIKQTRLTKQEINYFQNILSQIELASATDLDGIKLELQQEGYLKRHKRRRSRRSKRRINQPERFRSDDGSLILVGKNNLQNERLTLRTANKRDTWLHTRRIHGSHVIIKALNPTQKTLTQAATLAAYYSKGRESANVPVDYVKVKHVRKPNGTPPGFVIYTGQKTLFVTPTAKKVEHLKDNLKQA